MEKQRLFIGIPVDDKYANLIIERTAELDNSIWRKTEKENLHLTVLFIGDVDSNIIPYIEEIVENISGRTRPFSLMGGRTKIMRPDEPTMLWIKYEKNKYFENLVSEIEKYFKKIGTWEKQLAKKEYGDRNPTPHITLARIRGGGMLDSLLPPFEVEKKLESFTARNLVLFKTIRNKEIGITSYEIINEWKLGKE